VPLRATESPEWKRADHSCASTQSRMRRLEATRELGLQIAFGLRDTGGEPVVRSRSGDQQGRAVTRVGRRRRQDVVDFNITIPVQRHAGRVRDVSCGVAETAAGTWCAAKEHGQNPLAVRHPQYDDRPQERVLRVSVPGNLHGRSPRRRHLARLRTDVPGTEHDLESPGPARPASQRPATKVAGAHL
jgi:hypothetical protein